jgi:hypothetical protein
MKILSRHKQNDVYQGLVRIIAELQKSYIKEPNDDVRYAIEDCFDIALIVGDHEMLDAMSNINGRSFRDRVGDKLSNMVELIDDAMDCQWR